MLEYIPRKQIVEYLKDGWRLVAGHEYLPGDYAVVMIKPDQPEALSPRQMSNIRSMFLPEPRRIRSNLGAAAVSRNTAWAYAKRETA
ncbi:MAG: hypothetical protein E5Y10_24530 [Mesorhizobium sp.]|nr:MAG: hypothetical protein E5Y10_24530 [Mesorhizobium sp.]